MDNALTATATTASVVKVVAVEVGKSVAITLAGQALGIAGLCAAGFVVQKRQERKAKKAAQQDPTPEA